MVFSPYHESWRKHPMLNGNLREMFPGMRYAVALFSTYVVFEFVSNKLFPPSHGHGHGHGHDEELPDTASNYGGVLEPKAPAH